MENLPNEILENIFIYCDNNSLLKLSLCNKNFNDIFNKNYIWKYKCNNIYNVEVIPKKYKNNWKTFYLYLYKNCCVNCSKITSRIHIFYNVIICSDCQKNSEKYKTINLSRAKEYYSLTEKDISVLQSKLQRYNGITLRLFLESEIIDIYRKKFPTKNSIICYLIKKEHQKRSNLIKKHDREMILVKEFNKLNINFNTIDISRLNEYSSGMYNSFLRLKDINQIYIYKMTKIALEYYFLCRFSYGNYNYNTENIENIIKMSLLDLTINNERTEFLNKVKNTFFKQYYINLYIKFSKNIEKKENIQKILEKDYDSFFVRRCILIFNANIIYSSEIYKYIYFHKNTISNEEMKFIIEYDILNYFFKHMINNYNYKIQNNYNSRLKSIISAIESNRISIEEIDSTILKCLKNYFVIEDYNQILNKVKLKFE